MTVEEKYQRLVAQLHQLGSVLVAFSGGVDSTLLLVAAQEALGERVLAVIARSPSFPGREYEAAVQLAAGLGVSALTIESQELSSEEYRRNPEHRCYICKQILFSALIDQAKQHGMAAVVEGSNSDDEHDFRPGMKAARELGARAPLLEVGLTKGEIRQLARARGLPVWNKPSLACLASRVPYHSPITAERLRRIDQAEEVIRTYGVAQVRVRDHGPVARIEVEPASIERFLDPTVRQAVVSSLKALGFLFISLDLAGYRSGALNEIAQPNGSRDRFE